MGNSIKACENCFSEQQIDPRKTSLKDQNGKHNKQEQNNKEEVPLMKLTPVPLSHTEDTPSDDKKHKGPHTASDDEHSEKSAKKHKNKKPCQDDFTLLKVPF